MYEIRLTRQAEKDPERILLSNFQDKVRRLMATLESDPFQPPFEKLVGDLAGAYSRRINLQHRLVYRVEEDTKRVIILRMWTHYSEN